MSLRLSIIIPVFNTEKYLEKCLNSCLNQDLSLDEYEIILIDDGSTDSSLEVLNKYKSSYENIVVITQENSKQGAARNKGLLIARGDYVWFVDSDDYIQDNCLRGLIEIVENEELDVLAFNAEEVDELGLEKKQVLQILTPNMIYDGKEAFISNKYLVSPPMHLIRREVIVNNDIFFTEKIFYEDVVFFLKLIYYQKRLLFIENSYYFVVIRNGSATRSDNYMNYKYLITVINGLIDFYLSNGKTNYEKKTIAKRIATCQNSVLILTMNSKPIFKQAANELLNIKILSKIVFNSGQVIHLLQNILLFIPSLLRKLIIVYYNRKTYK